MTLNATPEFDPARFDRDGDVSRETRAAFDIYESQLRKWQRAVNLVGPATLDEIWHRHFLDSAQLVPLIPPRTDGRAPVILDIGSGAGFPGLVLAILAATGAVPAPCYVVHLVEANGRKCAFLREVARLTGADVTVHQVRVESLPVFPVDVITARACAPLPKLLDLVGHFIDDPQICPFFLFLKGKTAREELTESAKKWKMRSEIFTSMTGADGVVLRLKDVARD
jgi:16S rRNA (guanine527-N7)-methyltransferase